MFLRFTSRTNADGGVVRYVALAHNRRVDGRVKPDVLMNLGRADQVDVAGLRRLAASMLGATVMPHAIYLHSALSRDRHLPHFGPDGSRRDDAPGPVSLAEATADEDADRHRRRCIESSIEPMRQSLNGC